MNYSRARRLTILALLLFSCAGNTLDELKPKLVVQPGTPTDGHGHYVLDFGMVGVGTTNTLSLAIEDEGRVVLVVSPVTVTAPFSTSLAMEMRVAANASLLIPFTFAPTSTGPAEQTVTIASNGGSATVLLKGVGTAAPPPPSTCVFSVNPIELDFGNVTVGQRETRTFNVSNTSTAPCEISALSLVPTSNPVFTLAGGPTIPWTLGPGGTIAVTVQVAPTQPATSLTGSIRMTVGTPRAAGTTGLIPLQATATETPPMGCSFDVAPTTLNFGSVPVGPPTSLSFQVTNTGSANCVATELQLGLGTASAFALTNPPAVPFTLAAGAHQTVTVTLTPSSPSPLLLGQVLVRVGTQGATGTQDTVSLLASVTQNCQSPQSNGACGFGQTPVAKGAMYLNDDQSLYSFDPTTNRYALIGNFNGPDGFFSMFDIAIDSTGHMAGMNEGGILYAIDPTTAKCTRVAVGPDSSANGLSFTPSGKLVITGAEVDVYDPTTGQFSNLVPAGHYTSWGDIVGLPDGLLYWSAVAPDGTTSLIVTVDPNTGALHEIGNTGVANIWGLSYAGGVLYGFTDGGEVVQINASTAASQTTNIGGNWYGAATNPAMWQ